MASVLCERLHARMVSTGTIQRQLAAKRGVTTLELNQLAESDPEIDRAIDQISKDLNDSDEALIIDSRMAWNFVPSSLKVYLTVDERLAAERIFADERQTEHKYANVDEVLEANRARRASEIRRFSSTYGVNIADWRNFDLVINTTATSPDDIADLVEHYVWKTDLLEKANGTKYFASPTACFPTESNAFRQIPEEGIELTDMITPKVAVVVLEGTNFIYGDHAQVANSILLKKPFIPLSPIAVGLESLLPNGLKVSRFVELLPSISSLYDWEEALRFRFYRYPEFYKSPR